MNHIVRQFSLVFLTGCTAWAQLNVSNDLPAPRSAHAIEAFPGKPTDYHGVAAYTVLLGSEKAVVFCPDKPAEGRLWVLAPSLYDLIPLRWLSSSKSIRAKSGDTMKTFFPQSIVRPLPGCRVAIPFFVPSREFAARFVWRHVSGMPSRTALTRSMLL